MFETYNMRYSWIPEKTNSLTKSRIFPVSSLVSVFKRDSFNQWYFHSTAPARVSYFFLFWSFLLKATFIETHRWRWHTYQRKTPSCTVSTCTVYWHSTQSLSIIHWSKPNTSLYFRTDMKGKKGGTRSAIQFLKIDLDDRNGCVTLGQRLR